MFIAYLKQKSYGCDYTIDCGSTLIELSATAKEKAIEELKELIVGEYSDGERNEGYWEESALKSVCFYEVSLAENMPVSQWYAEAIESDKLQEEKKVKNEEYAEYERLKNKFEG